MQVKWLRRALLNLEQEAAWIAQDDPRAAAALVTEADAATRLLAQHPDMGRPGRVPGTRELVLPHFPCIIPYRVKAQRVEILRVFHTARKWPPGFGVE
ncbi:MAG: plasmid stabilization protein [Thiobacillus sp. 63-78]|uniref:type II toxin-antitoxin system RelE/ParE family toxin n=1 Tax=Thiobacillus sp. 63-78 TaxID=1895859 RepID=UPI0009645CB2|nr:type II toxin-antitoxin system RelE/ParE family toxin [Thiobacillus sp. 63-78]OJZ16617.1 MAG: plasmid stabilization protein [Thiobacillus sp. 63-78]